MDIESPEAAEVLVRGIDSNARALKDFIRIVKKMRNDINELKWKVDALQKKVEHLQE
jgi:hypothetical protein